MQGPGSSPAQADLKICLCSRESTSNPCAAYVVKRLFDLCLSGLGLIASAPLWGIIAGAIRAEDGGPVFFSQQRVGQGGQPFTAYKFRSMHADAALAPPRQAQEDDPRVTRIGRLLRTTALDELPQLWNIFRGDMSFVGPRPLMLGEIEVHGDGPFVPLDQIPGYTERHSVRPGLTGLTQVFASRDIRRQSKFRLDLLYVRRATLWLDVRLVGLSFWITLRGRWESRNPKV
jgi:lipopolysaccharide/colanic/teichoic acid biosynthesis glycosyltransferase